MRRTTPLIALLLLAFAALAHAEPAKQPVEITGIELLSEPLVRKAAGRPPRGALDLHPWMERATQRVEQAYLRRGYDQVRVFSSVTEDGRPWLHVDEGVMSRIVFTGVSDYEQVIMRVDLNLPQDVFRESALDDALTELRRKYRLTSVEWEVVETEVLVPMPTGQDAPQRALVVRIEKDESFGWGISVGLDSTWGLLPRGTVSARDALLADDRVYARLEIAVPYRRYLFDEEPQAQWVHGLLATGWRLPSFAGGLLAPTLDASLALSRYGRADAGIRDFLALRPLAIAGLLFEPVEALHLSVGVGFEMAWLTAVELTSEGPHADTGDIIRGVARIALEVDLPPTELRSDYRSFARLTVTGALSDASTMLLHTALEGRQTIHMGGHVLMFRERAIYMTGDVRFFDEAPLPGDTMRVFFSNRWWVREAGQLEVAPRFSLLTDTVKLGLFVDGAVFFDRRNDDPVLSGAFGGGPSLHFLLFDLLALDLYYGFGVDVEGFAHNLSFSLSTPF